MSEKRTEGFRRNEDLESMLTDVNHILAEAEQNIAVPAKQKYPVIFVMGPLRSGTTLMTQWIASTGEIAYPSNMLSRFYQAPIIGAKIQRLLTDPKYNFRNEILDFTSTQNFQSNNGKTKGALSPNEFWYFWRRFIKFPDGIDYLSDEELLKNSDWNTMKKELIGIMDVFEKPFALKGMICNYNIGFLNQIFDKAIFVYVRRNPYTNTESILKARERQSGDINTWYGFHIMEYEHLIKISDPVKQVSGQVYHINQAVQKDLEKIDEKRKMIVQYEDFCDNPEKYYGQLVEKLSLQGCTINQEYHGEAQFSITRTKTDAKIVSCYDEYVTEYESRRYSDR